MNFYELIYLNIYLSFSRTNKSIPEWSTIISLSLLFIFNLISILTLANIEMKSLEKTEFNVISGIIFGIHYLYFQNGNRIIKKITKLKPKVNMTNRILTILYAFGTISLFSYSVNLGFSNYIILIIGISTPIIIVHYFLGERNKQFD